MSHKDIKPENISIESKSPNKESTIIDYGISCYKELKDFKNVEMLNMDLLYILQNFFMIIIFGNNLPEKLEKI